MRMLGTLAAAAVLAAGSLQMAQADTVTWKGSLSPASVKAGQKAKVVVTAAIDPAWHIYSMTTPAGGPQPTSVKLAAGGPFSAVGKPAQPAPHKSFDSNFKVNVETYAGKASFTVPVTVSPKASGKQTATVTVRFMACNDHNCLPPQTVQVPVTFTVKPAGKH